MLLRSNSRIHDFNAKSKESLRAQLYTHAVGTVEELMRSMRFSRALHWRFLWWGERRTQRVVEELYETIPKAFTRKLLLNTVEQSVQRTSIYRFLMLCGWKTKETLNHATRNSTRRSNPRSGFQRFYFNLQDTDSAARSLIDSDRSLLSRFLFPQNFNLESSRAWIESRRRRRGNENQRKQTMISIPREESSELQNAKESTASWSVKSTTKTIQNCKGKSKTEVQKRAIRYWLPAAKETTPIIENEGPCGSRWGSQQAHTTPVRFSTNYCTDHTSTERLAFPHMYFWAKFDVCWLTKASRNVFLAW